MENPKETAQEIVDVYRLENGKSEANIGQILSAFQGTYNSPEEWAAESLRGYGINGIKVPEELMQYIDLTKYARDMQTNGVSFIRHQSGKIWVYELACSY